MNLQQLRYLVGLGDAPSLTAAADQLGVTQPVLSRSLRALERELGTTLFRVEGRRLTLTDEGRVVLAAARTAVRAADRVRDAARRSGDAALTVAAMPRHQWLVGELLPRLPDLALRITSAGSTEEALRLVSRGKVELAIGLLEVRAPDLEFVAAGRIETVVVSPPGTDLPSTVRPEDIASLSLAAPAPNSDRRVALSTRLFPGGAPHEPRIVAEDRSVLIAAVLAGTCSTLDARCLAETVPGVEIRSFDPPQHLDVVVARLPGTPSAETAAFLDAIADPPWH
jgi:DNA-binding transcriptional LysR family regulator